jgi:endoglycosylceramidase
MYQHVSDAIREVDTTHILILEHSYFGNTGISSGIEQVKKKNGDKDQLVAYAAHGYDLLVNTKEYNNQSNSRVEFIFSRINETSCRINVPVLGGGWGALSGNSEGMISSALFITGLFERLGFSKTVIQPIKNSKAGYLIIPVTGNSPIRTVEFRLKN